MCRIELYNNIFILYIIIIIYNIKFKANIFYKSKKRGGTRGTWHATHELHHFTEYKVTDIKPKSYGSHVLKW